MAAALAAGAVALAVVIGSLAARVGGATAPAPAGPTPDDTAAGQKADEAAVVFRQPLVAGCATADAVYVFSDGGGIARYDGVRWELVDASLRTFSAAACDTRRALAVGPAGAVAQVDEAASRISLDPPDIDDLYAVSLAPDGAAFLAGARGTVRRRSAAGDEPYARGIEEDLFAVAAFGPTSAWVAGSAGSAYRLEPAGWRPVPTGTPTALRALAGPSASEMIAAGDAGTLLRFDGGWRTLESGTREVLRSATYASGAAWVVGDGGTALVIDRGATAARRLDLATTCPLRAVFARGDEVWIVGSRGDRAAIWRVTGPVHGPVQRWGDC